MTLCRGGLGQAFRLTARVRSSFPGYYRPSDQEFALLWREATFVFDASVLLNLYGYSTGTRGLFLDAVSQLGERVWLPWQFAEEYQRNRLKSIQEQVKHHADVEKALRQVHDQHFASKSRHPFISAAALRSFTKLRKTIAQGRSEHEALFSRDPYFERVSDLFSGRVGRTPTSEALEEMHVEAAKRLKAQVPPGFCDLKDKGEPGAYGDYIGWREVLNHAKSRSCSVVLVDRFCDVPASV